MVYCHSVEFKADGRRQMNIAVVAFGGLMSWSVTAGGSGQREVKSMQRMLASLRTLTHKHVEAHMRMNG